MNYELSLRAKRGNLHSVIPAKAGIQTRYASQPVLSKVEGVEWVEGKIPMAKYDIPDTSDENDYKDKQ